MAKHPLMAAALALGCSAASAHDTWFEALAATESGEAVFALGTGNQFPALDTPVRLDGVVSAGCGDSAKRSVPLRWMADQPTRMLMRSTRPLPAKSALSCVARLAPAEVSIDDPTVELYFKEAQPPESVRERWKQLREKGVRWQETYTKIARIMMGGSWASGDTSRGLDVQVLNSQPVLRAGDTLEIQVLLNGQPLAGQMMEMRNDLSRFGIWRQSDEQGRISFPLPLAARWLLRGIHLRPAASDNQRWESDFLTVALDVSKAAN